MLKIDQGGKLTDGFSRSSLTSVNHIYVYSLIETMVTNCFGPIDLSLSIGRKVSIKLVLVAGLHNLFIIFLNLLMDADCNCHL